jgi:hypothetical protein
MEHFSLTYQTSGKFKFLQSRIIALGRLLFFAWFALVLVGVDGLCLLAMPCYRPLLIASTQLMVRLDNGILILPSGWSVARRAGG